LLENKLIAFTLNIQKLCIIRIPGTGDTFWHYLFKMHQWISTDWGSRLLNLQ